MARKPLEDDNVSLSNRQPVPNSLEEAGRVRAGINAPVDLTGGNALGAQNGTTNRRMLRPTPEQQTDRINQVLNQPRGVENQNQTALDATTSNLAQAERVPVAPGFGAEDNANLTQQSLIPRSPEVVTDELIETSPSANISVPGNISEMTFSQEQEPVPATPSRAPISGAATISLPTSTTSTPTPEPSPASGSMVNMTREELRSIAFDKSKDEATRERAMGFLTAYNAGEHPSQVGTSMQETQEDLNRARQLSTENLDNIRRRGLTVEERANDMQGGAGVPQSAITGTTQANAQPSPLANVDFRSMGDNEIIQAYNKINPLTPAQMDAFNKLTPEQRNQAASALREELIIRQVGGDIKANPSTPEQVTEVSTSIGQLPTGTRNVAYNFATNIFKDPKNAGIAKDIDNAYKNSLRTLKSNRRMARIGSPDRTKLEEQISFLESTNGRIQYYLTETERLRKAMGTRP
jgi:hypothetical protein